MCTLPLITTHSAPHQRHPRHPSSALILTTVRSQDPKHGLCPAQSSACRSPSLTPLRHAASPLARYPHLVLCRTPLRLSLLRHAAFCSPPTCCAAPPSSCPSCAMQHFARPPHAVLHPPQVVPHAPCSITPRLALSPPTSHAAGISISARLHLLPALQAQPPLQGLAAAALPSLPRRPTTSGPVLGCGSSSGGADVFEDKGGGDSSSSSGSSSSSRAGARISQRPATSDGCCHSGMGWQGGRAPLPLPPLPLHVPQQRRLSPLLPLHK